jgi:hypothetical protein
MRRSSAATLTAAALVGIALPVAASPQPVDHGRFAAADVVFTLGHGQTLQVEFQPASLSGGQVLAVYTERCNASGSCMDDLFSSALPDGSFTIDATTAKAELTTTVSGQPLHITWTPSAPAAGPVVLVGSGHVGGNDSSTTASDYAGDPADVAVSLGDRQCTGSGGVGDGVVAAPDTPLTPQSGQPVDQLHVRSSAPMTCS